MPLSIYSVTPGGCYTLVTAFGTYSRLDAPQTRRLYASLRQAGLMPTILAA